MKDALDCDATSGSLRVPKYVPVWQTGLPITHEFFFQRLTWRVFVRKLLQS